MSALGRPTTGAAERAGATADRAATVRAGLAALGKCALLLVGVPATLVRLWLLASPPGRPWTNGGDLLTHAVLAAVAAGWLVAGVALVRDLAGALSRRPLDPSSWSRRWALRLAALLLMLGAGAASGVTGRGRAGASPSVAVGAPAAAGTVAGEHTGSLGRSDRRGPVGDPILPLAGIVVAAGVGALVGSALTGRARLLRRATAALRRPGERQAPPSPASARLELLLAGLGGEALVEWADGASRLLWRSLRAASPGTVLPDVRLVRVGPDGVELLLGAPIPAAPAGFQALEGGRWWCLDPNLDLAGLRAATEGCGRLLPALVPVGEDGTAAYLLHVPPGRRLALTGDPVRSRRALAGVLLALRCLPWADELAAELVGVEPPSPAERCYHLSASSPEELAALAEGATCDPLGRLAERWSRQPLVVTTLGGDPDHEALLERCRERAGVVALGGRGDLELVLDANGAWIEPEGLRVAPLCPSPAQEADVVRLLAEAAAAPEPAREGAPPTTGLGAGTRWPTLAQPGDLRAGHLDPSSPALAPAGRIELRLLDGPPRLEGSDPGAVTERDRGRVIEIVAYLAARGGTADLDDLRTDLFLPPVAPDAGERLERLLAAVRAGLGLAGDGTALLRRVGSTRLELHPEVTLDAARLADAAAAARTAAPERAERLLRDGLTLVGPRPCSPMPGYPWLTASGRRDDLIATVVDAAHHLALLALAKGDTVLARWAVDQGRRAEPCAEILARDLMLACDADGDAGGTVAAWQALEKGLAGLGGHEPSEETRELYASLLHRPR